MTASLDALARLQLPRMLTQVCRDPGSPFYGCWDRNWWHYKMRDFPSVILQQGGYAIHLAAELPLGRELGRESLRAIAAASARFWNLRALRHGAFEEYYPFEQGYPPLAFSTLSTAKLVLEGVLSLAEVRAGLAVAARQLLDLFEAQAANQQVAGTAALAAIRKLDPSLVPGSKFQEILARTLALQHEEGWFPEYDGPDLGYLSVTMDCLWDIHDLTGEPSCRKALSRALRFIAWFVLGPLGRAGMHNSRNTDYLVPYGLARMAAEASEDQALAIRVFQSVFADSTHAGHFFAAVDDRYWCHYIGHSVMRALGVLQCAEISPVETSPVELPHALPGCGHSLLHAVGVSAVVSARKGGVVTARWSGGQMASDYGWIIRRNKLDLVSHWWSPDWDISLGNGATTTTGNLVPHKEHTSSPAKHAALRIGSWVAGRRLIKLLKSLLIFKKVDGAILLKRHICFDGPELVVRDEISGLESDDEVTRAPRSSKRHVASADSFHGEDLQLLQGVSRAVTMDRSSHIWTCESRYRAETGGEHI